MYAATAVAASSRHDVHVHVRNRLPRRGSIVDANRRSFGAHGFADGSDEARHGRKESVRIVRVEIFDARDVRMRDDEDVSIRERSHVEERERPIVASDDLGGDLTRHDATENAAHDLTLDRDTAGRQTTVSNEMGVEESIAALASSGGRRCVRSITRGKGTRMPIKNGTAGKKKEVSRQTLWQRRHRELGLCVVCSEPAFKGWRCVKHYEQHKINMRFRYIPRVRGRYNVGGATETTTAQPGASAPRKLAPTATRSAPATRARGGRVAQPRYAKA